MVDETSSLRGSSAPRSRQHTAAVKLLVASLAVVGCTCLLWQTGGKPVELEWRALSPGAVHSVTPKVTSAVQHKSKAYGQHKLDHLFGIQHFPGYSLASPHSHMTPLAPSLKKAPRTQELTDGYMDAGAYLQGLESQESQQQAEHIKKWKAKNLKAGKKMVKDADALYKKWVMVDPYTGISKPDLQIPRGPASRSAIRSRSPARKQMMMEVEADNGKTYTLPWFCIGVHPEADGSGVGWDGAKAPMGPHGRGVDCSPPWLKASPAATQLLAQAGGRLVPLQGLAEEEEQGVGAEEPIGDMIDALGGKEEAEEEEKEAAEEEEAAEGKEEAGAEEEAEERKELGDDVFEIDQGDGDVLIKADTLMPWMFGVQ